MRKLLAREPALAAAIAALISAVIGLVVGNPALAGALGGVVLAFLGVRQVVTPVATATAQTVEAAAAAATDTARLLTDGVAGAVGELTQPAKTIVADVIADITNPIVRR